MVTTVTIGKDKGLLGYVHPVNEIKIDNKTASKADEVGAFVSQLVTN